MPQENLKKWLRLKNIYIYVYMSVLCVCAHMHAHTCQLYLTLFDPMDCGPLGSSVHGILQAKILKWVDISSSRGYS